MSTGYTSPESMIAISVVLPVLAGFAISLRFYTRKRQKNPLLLDDWILLPAWLFTVAMGVATIIGVHGHGIGYPTPPPSAAGARGTSSPEYRIAGKVEWTNLWLQPLALGCIKISLLAFYARIFGVHKSGLLYVLINVLIGLTVAWIIAFFFAMLFMCGTHFHFLWGAYNDISKCSFGHALWIDEALAISDFCFDIILFFLPLPKIWSLQLEINRRLQVCFIFLIGASAVLGSILRMIVFIQVQRAVESKDASVDGLILVSRFLFWSIFEAGLAIIAVCLPTLQALSRKVDKSILFRSVRSMMSLLTVRSGSSRSDRDHSRRSMSDDMSTSSDVKIVHSSVSAERGLDYRGERYAMHDIESMPHPDFGQIRVQNDFKQSSFSMKQVSRM